MSEFRVASRYAKSLLELAEEQGSLDAVLEDMVFFNEVCEENRSFVLMLKNPIVKHDKKKAILNAIFDGKVNKITLAIFNIVTRKNREAMLPAIAREFKNQYNIFKGIQKARVTTAIPLSKELKDELENIVMKISSKEKVQLEEVVNEDIIGGFVLTVGDRQLDDSIKSKLKALELKFSQNPYIKEF